jgi:hypothetical protein
MNAARARAVRFTQERMFENICMMKKIRVGANTMKYVWAAKWSQHDVHAIQERQRSVLTNQCLGKDTNAEPPGRGSWN